MIIYTCITIALQCIPGLKYSNLGYSNGKYYGIDRGVISIGKIAENIRDIYLSGSFCPPSTGNYSFKYTGSIDAKSEPFWSSYQYIDGKYGRESPIFRLNKISCYKYSIAHSTNIGYATGTLYFKYMEDGSEWVIMNSSVSYSCYLSFCKEVGDFPNCYKSITKENNERNNALSLIFSILCFFLIE